MTHTPLYVRMVDAPGVFSVSDDTLTYARSDLPFRRRIVMAKWADHVTGKAAEVVQLRRG